MKQSGTRMAFLAAAAGLIFSMHAAASEPAVEEIVVVGAPITITHERGTNNPVMREETVELNREVSIADLDPTRQADVQTLRKRVREMAQASCETLKDMFPVPPSSRAEVERCVKEAVAGAEDGIETAIASANP